MPKLRPSAALLQNRTIIATIKYGMEMAGVSNDELALAMRTSTVTLYDRLKHPENFRLKELRAVGQKLHIPVEKLIQSEDAHGVSKNV